VKHPFAEGLQCVGIARAWRDAHCSGALRYAREQLPLTIRLIQNEPKAAVGMMDAIATAASGVRTTLRAYALTCVGGAARLVVPKSRLLGGATARTRT